MSTEYDISSKKHHGNGRRLYVYYKNKISITMCDVSKEGGGGGVQRNVHITFNLPVMSKILERVVFNQLYKFLNEK
jgi:hypothetical protein